MSTWPYLTHEHPIRLAHRGSKELWPENTMVAFAGAVEMGYRYLETDVRMTADGVVVAFHDSTLDRTTNATGSLAEWRWEELRHLDAGWHFGEESGYPRRGSGVTIPRLDELFATWPDACFNIDLKAPGIEWAVAEVVMRAGRQDSVCIGSFHDRRINRFRRITQGEVATSAGPVEASRAFLASRRGRPMRTRAAALQLPYAVSSRVRVDTTLVDAAHAAGVQVHAWTVNEAPDMEQLLDAGVDGIITDRPDILNEVVARRAVPD